MTQAAPRVVTFHYTLTDPTGNTLDSSVGEEPLTYMEGAGQIIPGLESELHKLKVGDKGKISVKAADAYGERDDTRLVKVPRDKLPNEEIQVGDQLHAVQDGQAVPLVVIALDEASATLDANHPLAGIDLTFDVEVTAMRDATKEEIEHGHAHGPDGHHHH